MAYHWQQVLNLAYCAPWRWYTSAEKCRRQVFNICIINIGLVQYTHYTVRWFWKPCLWHRDFIYSTVSSRTLRYKDIILSENSHFTQTVSRGCRQSSDRRCSNSPWIGINISFSSIPRTYVRNIMFPLAAFQEGAGSVFLDVARMRHT